MIPCEHVSFGLIQCIQIAAAKPWSDNSNILVILRFASVDCLFLLKWIISFLAFCTYSNFALYPGHFGFCYFPPEWWYLCFSRQLTEFNSNCKLSTAVLGVGSALSSDWLQFVLCVLGPRVSQRLGRFSHILWGPPSLILPFLGFPPHSLEALIAWAPSLVLLTRKKGSSLSEFQPSYTSSGTADALRVMLQNRNQNRRTGGLFPSETLPPSIDSLPKSACFCLLLVLYFSQFIWRKAGWAVTPPCSKQNFPGRDLWCASFMWVGFLQYHQTLLDLILSWPLADTHEFNPAESFPVSAAVLIEYLFQIWGSSCYQGHQMPQCFPLFIQHR